MAGAPSHRKVSVYQENPVYAEDHRTITSAGVTAHAGSRAAIGAAAITSIHGRGRFVVSGDWWLGVPMSEVPQAGSSVRPRLTRTELRGQGVRRCHWW